TDPKLETATERVEAWQTDPLLKAILTSEEEVDALDVRRAAEGGSRSALREYLLANKGPLAVVVPLRSHSSKGCLLLPCPKETTGSTHDLKQRLPKRHLKLLQAYAALIASCIESEQSHVTS